ncbi:MAG: LysR family transcriptional regulator [Burkholderiaceae bacterium]
MHAFAVMLMSTKPPPTRHAAPLPALELAQVRTLVALLEESSVSRAAAMLGQSQPQTSTTLGRLRTQLHDPILVRGSHGMVPTVHALTLLEPARRILADMRSMLAAPENFSPQTLRGQIQIAVPDYLSPAMLGAIFGAIRVEAPQATLLLRAVHSETEGAEMLESGKADVLIESVAVLSASIRFAPLFEDSVLSVAARSSTRPLDTLDLQTYLDLPHVAAAPASGLRPGLIDHLLAQQGLSRRVVAQVPHLNTLPAILAASDLVFTTTARLANHIASHAALQVFAPPVTFPRVRYLLMWHERTHRTGQHQWLRALLRQAIAQS